MWKKHPDDWYVEETWVDHRLFEEVHDFGRRGIIDPCCGMGRIVRAARARGYPADGTDIKKRFHGCAAQVDFFSPAFVDLWRSHRKPAIVSNPPFSLAFEFVQRALQLTKGDATVLLPITWICGDERSRWLDRSGLARVLFLTPRPSMPPGEYIQAGNKPGQGWADFAWYLWRRGHHGDPHMGWLRRDD